MQRLLTQEEDRLLQRERALLDELRLLIAQVNATEQDLTLLKTLTSQMDELFLLVVVGEFNAGKTAFLNALLGEKLLTEGVTPTTSHIHILRYGEQLQQETTADDSLLIQLPVEWLRDINLVDTPGTNAVVQRHQEITEEFVPRSDLVLFVTSADRPFSESERTFLTRIRQWSKKIIVIVNKIDLIEDPADQQRILDFVRENGRALLGAEPQIFAVSTRKALQAKQRAQAQGEHPQGDLWQASRFAPLERFMLEQLDDRERLRLKLENPLGVANKLIDYYTQVINERQTILKGDFDTLDTIEDQLVAYAEDMRRDFAYQRSRVDNVLYEMAERGDQFFDDTLRIGRLMDLMNSEKVRGEFEREVVADTSRKIERHVSELIDWVVDKDYRQWRAVVEYISRRAAQHVDHMIGNVNSDFEINRQNLLASVGRNAQQVVDSYDHESDALKLAQEVQMALFQTAAVEVGAIGLGAVLVAVLNGVWLDITGILGASVVAALGLYVLPYRRGRVKAELREKVNQLRTQLDTALTRQFEQELSESQQRMREAIAPYTRFVRVEREKLEKLDAELRLLKSNITQLRNEIGAL
ncbi:MAG: dynamin family protein [Caldilineaceae bacterium]|nr:dynamin family protein [Caldilineaceae bacterium]